MQRRFPKPKYEWATMAARRGLTGSLRAYAMVTTYMQIGQFVWIRGRTVYISDPRSVLVLVVRRSCGGSRERVITVDAHT